MGEILSLKKHKSKGKAKKLLSDLQEIDKIMAMSLKALGYYKHYTPVRQAMNSIYEHKLDITRFINKIKNELEESKE